MIDVGYLERLISLLKSQGVQSFKTAGVELSFGPLSLTPKEAPVSPPAGEFVNVDEGQLPVDLRSDAIADHDKVLNWSAPPSPQDEGAPGADDLPLTLAQDG